MGEELLKHKSHTILKVKKLKANKSIVVPGSATTILLQCGQYRRLLVLTRMDLQICPSGWTKDQLLLVQKWIHFIGGAVVKDNIEEALFLAAKTTQDIYQTVVLPNTSPAMPPTT